MADIKDLRIRIQADTKGLKDISNEAKKTADAINKIKPTGFSQLNQEGGKVVSTFSQMTRSTALLTGAMGGLAVVIGTELARSLGHVLTLPITLAKELFRAGAAAEQQILRIGTVLRIPEAEAKKAFEAIRAFAAPLPQTTDEIVNAFIRLAAVNLKPTEDNLRRVANAALATGQSVEDITTVLASTEVEPLRRLGIELDRTGKKAVIQFKDIRIQTEKTTQAVREGLLELFQRAFPDGIERSQKTFQTAFSTMKSLISDLVTGAGSNLTTTITEIVGKTNEWIIANKELIKLRLDQFVDATISAIDGLVSAIDLVIAGVGKLGQAFGPTKTFGPFRAETDASRASVDLLAGSYGHFITDMAISEGVIDDTKDSMSELSDEMLTAQQRADAIAAAWARSGQEANALSNAVGFLIGKVKEFGQIQPGAGGFNFTTFQQQTAAIVNTAIAASKLGGTFSGELDPALKKTELAIGSTTTKFSLFTDEQKETAKNIERNTVGLDSYASGINGIGDAAGGAGGGASKIDQLNKSLENQRQQLQRTVDTFGLSAEAIIEYDRRAAIAAGGSAELADEIANLRLELLHLEEHATTFGELFAEGIDEAVKQVKKLQDAFKQLDDLQTENLSESGQLQKELADRLKIYDELLIAIPQKEAEIQQAKIDTINRYSQEIADAEKQEYIARLKNSDSFFDQLEGGFLDFVDQVESNGELVSQFFADTLSQMSQNFSDLFYNVLTGKFDSLVDVAKAAFKSILRAFLDLVSAIVTRQIVISIGGLFGFGGTKGAGGGAGGVVGTGQQAVGLGTDVAGLFGAGGAFGTLFGGAAGSTAIAGTLGGIPITGGAAAGAGLIGGGAGIFATVGAAVTIIGAVLGAAALVFTFLAPLFKKTPRFAFKFESIETELGERAAFVKEFLDADFFADEIFKKIVGRGGKGAFSGKEVEELKKAIQQAIEGTIESVQAIINKLPEDMAEILNEALLNTAVDTETKIGRSNLLGFDAKGGKEIKERLEKFFQGDLQGRFLFAIRDFFQFAFEQLGVLPDKAAAFIDAEFEKFKAAKSPEERAAIGQELLASFNAFVDAFNIVSGNVNDAISITIANTKSLAKELGFEAVPSIGELREELGKLLENAELDPETVQKYVDLRNAIVQGVLDIGNAVAGLISKIQSLNQTIVSLGGAGVDLGPFLDQAQADLINFFQANVGDLSLAEQEAFLDEIAGFTQAQLAEERAAFEAEQAAAQAAAEAAKAAVQARIDGLNKEKDKINEIFRNRIDALNEELRIAEDFARLTEQIRETLDSILFSPESVLTGVEQVNLLQSRIANLQADISEAIDPEERLRLADQLREAFSNLFDAAGEAFGVNSPEFVAIFDQVTGGLENLADLTSSQGRSVEEINAEIEKLTAENQEILKGIDARIEAAQAQLSAIGQQTATNTFKASEKLQETLNWLRDEYLRILEERLNQLDEATTGGFENELDALEDVAQTSHEMLENLTGIHGEAQDTNGILKEISAKLGGGGGGMTTGGGTGVGGADNNPFTGLASGGIIRETIAGIGKSGRRYMIGEAGPEAVIPLTALRGMQGGNNINEMKVKIDINVNGNSPGAMEMLPRQIEDTLVRSIRQGRARKAVQEAANKAM